MILFGFVTLLLGFAFGVMWSELYDKAKENERI